MSHSGGRLGGMVFWGSSQTWLFQNWLFAIFTRKRSFALFGALTFALFCGLAFALFCAHLRVSASDRV